MAISTSRIFNGAADSALQEKWDRKLLNCARNGDPGGVQNAIANGANVNAQDKARGQKTALHYAARRGDLQIIKKLTDSNADPDIWDDIGFSPLFFAVSKNNTEAVKALISYGADPDARNPRRNTALHVAMWDTRLDIAAELIKAGADKTARNVLDESPLDVGLQEKDPEIDRILDLFSDTLNDRDSQGNTCLHKAAAAGKMHLALVLMMSGARHEPNHLGKTPADLAQEKGETNTSQVIEDQIAARNAKKIHAVYMVKRQRLAQRP